MESKGMGGGRGPGADGWKSEVGDRGPGTGDRGPGSLATSSGLGGAGPAIRDEHLAPDRSQRTTRIPLHCIPAATLSLAPHGGAMSKPASRLLALRLCACGATLRANGIQYDIPLTPHFSRSIIRST